jgi:uncharacterized protein (TIGR03545 family)
LRKQAVVKTGRVSGLRLGTLSDAASPTGRITWSNGKSDDVAREWLNRLNEQLTFERVQQFESVQRTEAFCASWAKQLAELDSRLQALDDRAVKLQKAIEAAQTNPLRNDKLLVELLNDVAKLQKESETLRADIETLPDRLETERRAIVAARRHDEQTISKQLHIEPAEADALSAYLLREETARQVSQLVGCLRWMRAAIPVHATESRSAGRGENVLFAGCRPQPAIVFRSLQLEGSARFGGQPVDLRGVLTNLTSQPRLHAEPVRLRLLGQGSMPLDLQATIDRTGSTPRDELLFDCQGVLVRGVALGDADQFGMNVSPSVGSLSVSVFAEGDRIGGEVQLVQQRVQITPALNGAAGKPLSAAMHETLGGVNSIATRLTLGGTLDQPTCTLWSNLGAAVAEAMRRALDRAEGQHARALLVEAGRRVDERLAGVDRQMAEKQSRIATRTNAITARLQRIASQETPRYRISAGQGGRRLPENSLFR